MDSTIPTKLAVRFAFTTGIDVDYLFAEAMEAYWKAEIDLSYDPSKSAFSSFAQTCVYRHLCSVVAEYKKKYSMVFEILDEEIPCIQPSPEHEAYFAELLRQLPADGKLIVHLVLNVIDGVPAYRVRATIRHLLKRRWTHSRIDRAFQSVVLMLKEADVG